MKILGYKISAFDTKDGKHITGVTFYGSYKSDSSECFGLCTDKYFISDQKLAGQKFEIGQEITPVYNRYGKVQSVIFK